MQKGNKTPKAGIAPSPKLRGHIWIEGTQGTTFLGYGRIALLERIREYGSITKAAKALEMSYRRAWVLIDSMNNQVSKPFVVTSAGGKRGGGTRVTAEGERAIAEFWKIHNDFQKFLKSKDRAVAAMLGGEKEDPGVLDAKKRKVPRASAADTLTHAAERKKGA